MLLKYLLTHEVNEKLLQYIHNLNICDPGPQNQS